MRDVTHSLKNLPQDHDQHVYRESWQETGSPNNYRKKKEYPLTGVLPDLSSRECSSRMGAWQAGSVPVATASSGRRSAQELAGACGRLVLRPGDHAEPVFHHQRVLVMAAPGVQEPGGVKRQATGVRPGVV